MENCSFLRFSLDDYLYQSPSLQVSFPCSEHGLFDSTILTIWLHGTIEITSIVIAGGAGLILGNGWLFPGTYPRTDALSKAGKKGMKNRYARERLENRVDGVMIS